MRQELQDKLFEEFPELYGREDAGEAFCLLYGFQVGDGWYDLIREMSKKMMILVERAWKKEADLYDFPFRFRKVKQKFGKLHCQMYASNAKMEDLLWDYEEKSAFVCEICGNPGKINRNAAWIETLCREHRVNG